MDISIQPVLSLGLDDRPWVASAFGLTTARTITIDPSKGFVDGTHMVDGYILSGVPLAPVAGANTFGVYDDTAADGREVCSGLLFGRVRLSRNAAGVNTAVKIAAALYWQGVVKLGRLPVALDANGQADLAAHIRFE